MTTRDSMIQDSLKQIQEDQRALSQGMHDKFDNVNERLNKVDVQLGIYNASLDTHIKRCDLLEESVQQMRADIKPLQEHTLHAQKTWRTVKWILGVTFTALITFLAEYLAVKH